MMILNYLKTAWRNIRKQKGYSLINLSGLAIGMACCLLILLFVQDELSYDRYHENAERIYRVIIDAEIGGSLSQLALCPFAAPPVFAEEIPEVEAYVRLVGIGRRQIIEYQEQSFEEEGIFLADETFFDIFTHKFLDGHQDNVLNEPGSVVLTQDTAQRLFGDEDALGKTLTFAPVGDLHVTGIIQNVPRNSHFHFNYLISFKSLSEQQRAGLEQWLSVQGYAYLLLDKQADVQAVRDKIPEIVENHTGQQARKFGISMQFRIQKMTDIHLYSNIQGEIEPNGSIIYVYVFSAIALFILLIACINFMNLSTARSSNRAREVGLRKVFGAFRKNLVGQFLSESMLISLASLILALGLASLALPLFNTFSGKEMTAGVLFQPIIVAGMLFLILFSGLMAGSYPAFFLSGFQPIAVFRGVLSKGAKSSVLRRVLVVFQFSLSVALIIGTGIVLRQIDYMKNKDLGFDKENMLVVPVQTPETARNHVGIKTELLQNPNITQATFSSGVPGRTGELRLMVPEGKTESETFSMYIFRCDYDYIPAYGMRLLSGRNFSTDFSTDADAAYIVNEVAARKFGWTPDEAVDKKLAFAEGRPGQIIGVVSDFHFQPLSEEIEPMALMLEKQALAFVSMRIDPRNMSAAIDFVREKWTGLEPGHEFDYFFLDEDLATRYASEDRLSDILSLFALLAIVIACLGLLGLASYTAEQRTREIGIRKVLGASTNSVILKLSKEFVKWVLIANVIAWPLTYWIMRNYWLSGFPYRTDPTIWIFLTAGTASIVIALITVGFQVVRAATANPADSLRHE
jgi:putative ABC transport system permease protein